MTELGIKQGLFACCVHGRFYGAPAVMHIYYDPALADCHRRDLFRTLESTEERLAQRKEIRPREAKRYSAFFDINRKDDGTFTFKRDYDKIDAADLNNGFFWLLSNTEFDSAEVLAIYKAQGCA